VRMPDGPPRALRTDHGLPGTYPSKNPNFRIADYTSTGQRAGLGSAASSGNNRQGDKADHTGTRDNIASAFVRPGDQSERRNRIRFFFCWRGKFSKLSITRLASLPWL
jgi:hypothetical protein